MTDRTLHLRPYEEMLFAVLPKELKHDWEIVSETEEREDNPEVQELLPSMLPIHDTALKLFIQEGRTCHTVEQMAALVQRRSSILDGVDNQMFAFVLAAMGPVQMDLVVEMMLRDIRSTEDLEGVARVTELRHGLLEKMPMT